MVQSNKKQIKVLNENLPIIKSGWKGNLIDSKGRYTNLDGPSMRGFKALMKWQLSTNPFAEEKKNQSSNVNVVQNSNFLEDKNLGFTWIGHTTYLFQIGPYKIITDPILKDIWPLKRYTPLPCSEEKFSDIDFILLSHNHRDHCDKTSLVSLCKRNPSAKILTGLAIGPMLKKWGIKNTIEEAGWYQRYLTETDLTIHYLPAKHWNRRYLHDLNTMLWGSFMIAYNGVHLYFGADSGMGIHYQEIKKLYPKIDYAFLGIGAYEPVWFMKRSHTSPKDVVTIKELMEIGRVVPMHYGTFDLSNEPVSNPKKVLQSIVSGDADYLFLDIGRKFIL
jgi:L-ascorbate metabolism protein UlaG (beta-lactamase superfamily)